MSLSCGCCESFARDILHRKVSQRPTLGFDTPDRYHPELPRVFHLGVPDAEVRQTNVTQCCRPGCEELKSWCCNN